MVMTHNRAKLRFPTLKTKVRNYTRAEHNIPEGSPRAQYIVLVLWQVFNSTALYGSPNKTSAMDVFPLLM